MLNWENMNKFFKKVERKNYHDIAQRVAEKDELVKEFIGKHENCSINAAPAGDREFIEYLGGHHHELSGYTNHPDRLFCVSFDSLSEGMMGTPERPMIKVYVDVKDEKIVTVLDTSNYRQAAV